MSTSNLIALLILLIAGGLLVVLSAAEAGVSALSRSRIRASHSNGLSALLHSYIRQRQFVLRALGVGTTATTLIAAAAMTYLLLEGRLIDARRIAIAGVAAFVFVSLLRQTTRTLVLLDPEGWGLRLARPITALQWLFHPLAVLVNLPATLALRFAGRSSAPAETDPVEELLALVEPDNGPESERTLSEERRMMRGVLEMSGQTVRELMTSRMDLTAISTEASLGDAMRIISESGYSRVPLYEDSLDKIVGVVYAKDLLAYLRTGDVTPTLTDIARPPYFVPESKRANELLADMRRDQVHMAVAVDEYGGTAGVVTVEDLVEEIVGEITDEYDIAEVDVQRISDDEAIVDARLPIDDLNDLFDTEIEGEDFDTVGGLVFTLLGRLAVPGDTVFARDGREEWDDDDETHGLELRVLSILGRRIKKVRVKRTVLVGTSASEAV